MTFSIFTELCGHHHNLILGLFCHPPNKVCTYQQQLINPNYSLGLPWWLRSKKPTCQYRRCGFDLRVGKIPWRRKWQPTPLFMPGTSHGQRKLVGYSPWGFEELAQLSDSAITIIYFPSLQVCLFWNLSKCDHTTCGFLWWFFHLVKYFFRFLHVVYVKASLLFIVE